MINCGHCKGSHETVADVRKCARVQPRDDAMPSTTNLTGKQQKFLRDLLSQLGLELSGDRTPETISYQDGQPIITALVAARRSQATGKPFDIPLGTKISSRPKSRRGEREPSMPVVPDVPAGYYALPGTNLDYTKNDLYFFRVVKTKGHTYVNMIVGGHPEYGMGFKRTIAVLDALLEFGVEEAGVLFGINMKQCRKCGRSLTKYASRQVLYGGHCAEEVGLGADWRELDALAKAQGLDNEEEAA